MRRAILKTAVAMLILPFGLAHATSDFPNKPLKLLVGYAPGGPADTIGRAIARELETELNQSVVVENRAGAAGRIALDAVTQSAPNGYTMGLLSNSTTTSLHFSGESLDMDKRFVPLGQFVATRLIMVANPEVADVSSLNEFVELAKREPGLPYASSGHGSPGHLGMEMFANQHDLNLTHIPYRGSAPAILDLVAGRFGFKVVDATTAMPFIKEGRIRPIVTVSTVRPPSLPDLPTAIEQGESAFQIDSTMSLIVPPGTPADIVDKLSTALGRAVDSEGFDAATKRAGNAKAWLPPAEYKVWLQSDFDRWGEAITAAGISTETAK